MSYYLQLYVCLFTLSKLVVLTISIVLHGTDEIHVKKYQARASNKPAKTFSNEKSYVCCIYFAKTC